MRRTAGPDLAQRVGDLRLALEIADGRLEVPEVAGARATLAKAGAREALGDATVVALAGATGSGKSTLFNRLSGDQVSTPGVLRPTTGVAHATTWGYGQERLLDWLQVPRRHTHRSPDPQLDGLVLLDLPDHDSTRLEHRLEVDRLVELVDLLVWVLDPQKYADAAVHDRYLAPLAGHAGVLVVVLNQVDRLDAEQRPQVVGDLRRLLDAEGLSQVPVLPLSGGTGEGVDALQALLRHRVQARRAATERLTADVRGAARALGAHCGSAGTGLAASDRAALTAALADAAGVEVVAQAVGASVRRDGAGSTGWPPVRWVRGLRPDPLRRLHLQRGRRDDRPPARTSLPPATPAQRAGVDTALRRARDRAGEGLPQAWRDDLRRTVDGRADGLTDRLDAAVAGADLGPDRPPVWQRAVSVVQWLLLAVALAGGLWLLALAALAYLQLGSVLPTPQVGRLPVPTLLLAAGVLSGLLLSALARPLVAAAARRRTRLVRRRLLRVVDVVVGEQVVQALDDAASGHARFCGAVTRAGA